MEQEKRRGKEEKEGERERESHACVCAHGVSSLKSYIVYASLHTIKFRYMDDAETQIKSL